MSFLSDRKRDLIQAMKAKDNVRKEWIRSIIAEFERQSKKDFSDDEVYRVIKSMIKLETERMEAVGEDESLFLEYLQSFLPKQATEEEIESWIKENVDFDSFKNKMQAMGIIMKHFGNSADGKTVKAILNNL